MLCGVHHAAKALDRVEYEYLYEVLQRFGPGATFIKVSWLFVICVEAEKLSFAQLKAKYGIPSKHFYGFLRIRHSTNNLNFPETWKISFC